MTAIRPGAYRLNGMHVHITVNPDGTAVLSRSDGTSMRVLTGDERARWLTALRLDEATP